MHQSIKGALRPALVLLLTTAGAAHAELQRLGEKELSSVSGQSGISIAIPHLRVNAYRPGSVDNPDTPQNEADGQQKNGFKLDYITRTHAGTAETHYFIDDVSLAMDVTGPITLDIEADGALLVGLPDSVNFVGDGLSLQNIYLNTTGTPAGGGKLLNEISVQGNFNTGGTVRMWSN